MEVLFRLQCIRRGVIDLLREIGHRRIQGTSYLLEVIRLGATLLTFIVFYADGCHVGLPGQCIPRHLSRIPSI